MKFKYLFLSLMLLIIVGSIAAISAEEATIGNYNFTMPDGFEIENQSDDSVILKSSDNHTISLTIPKQYTDSNEEIETIMDSQNYVLREENSFPCGDFDLFQYTVYYSYYSGFFYICRSGDDMILLTHVCEDGSKDIKVVGINDKADYDSMDIIYSLKYNY